MSTPQPAAATASPEVDPVAAAQRLSVATCLGFGVGTVGVSIMLNAVTPYFPAFMSTVLGQSPALAGTLLTLSKLYDAVADILIGRLSDRTRSRWGRRRPYLLIGAVVSAGSFLMLFTPPKLDDFWLLVYMSLGLIIYSTGYSLFNVPYMTMPSEMTDGYHERTRLLGYRMVFVSIGQVLSGAGTAALIQRGGGGAAGYELMGWVMALIIFGAMTAAFFGTAKARAIERSHAPARLPGGQVALLLKNRPFMLLATAKVFQFFGFSSVAVTGLLFLLNVVHVGYEGQATLALCQNVCTFLSLPFWVRAGRVIGKRNTYLIGVGLFVLGALVWANAEPGITTLGIVLRGIPSGIGAGAMLLMAISMLADTMAYDRRLTGLHREGLLSGIIAVLEKTSFALGAAVIGWMLSAAKYVPTVGGQLVEQPESAIRALYLTFSLIPAGIFALNLLCIWFYDLDEKKLQDDPV